ncbi:MAG: type I DNA topoisomerase [Candidatus Saelkia tenebricola]|nr:type I DNA topoisomerase [Candidatus Saelkia tenebricola]
MKKKGSLVIVESPAKAKTIQKYLGSNFLVRSCFGHVKDLPKSRMGVDVEDNFTPSYIVIPKKRKVVNALKKEIKDRQNLYLASDEDREGEAISWHLKNILGEGKNAYRVTFHEITKEAIQASFEDPHEIDLNKVNAQQARRVLDRIVGYSLSPLLWKKVGKGLSAGRVQSVALRLIVEREREVLSFIPQEYWDIEALLNKIDFEDFFKAKLISINGEKPDLKNLSLTEEAIKALENKEFFVQKVEEKEKKQNASAPFTTSTLQQESFNKLKFSAGKTMFVAQQLYEGLEVGEESPVGLITYMRTDSVKIANSALTSIREFIAEKFGAEYLPDVPNVYKKKGRSQEAHEAIRTTSIYRTPEAMQHYLNQDQFKLYELIWRRTLASQMNPAVYLSRMVNITADEFIFRATGRKMLFAGFTILISKEEEDKTLPDLTVGEKLQLKEIIPSQHFTKPSPKYNEASLVKIMEEKGIGRPSTYAPTIQTLIVRDYIYRRGGQLVPTDLGFLVIDLLIEHFPKVLDLGFTANIEEDLDKVEEGQVVWFEVVKEFYQPFLEQLENAKEKMRDVKLEAQETDQICELCGKNMLIKWGRNGRFLGCSGYPDCKNSKAITTGISCTEEGCGGELVKKKSGKGRVFYGCSNYPECRFTTSKLPE